MRVRSWLLTTFALLAVAAAILTPELLDEQNRERMARALTRGEPRNAPVLLQRYGCVACHTISSLAGADGKVGPALDGLRARVFIGGQLNNTADNLVRFVTAPRTMVPGTAMPDTGIKPDEARDVAAYLYSH